MFSSSLLFIIKLCLFIEIAYSFKPPKHDMIFYYKTPSNVLLTNEKNSTTYYGIYLAGQTIYINIPKSVVNVSDLVNWKVVNLNKNRLMFVHNKKPRILVNQETIKEMKYSGELSDSIIAFGGNEALHVPTISNPSLTKPAVDWNYLELLRFNVKNEKVSVIRRLPWFKDDDWRFIKEWKMTDYIHFNNKLYLLIKRSIWNEKTSKVTQEMCIIRLCLDKGSELLSSAVEMHFTRPEFNTNELHQAIFVYYSKLHYGGIASKSFYLCTILHLPDQSATIAYYYFDNLFPLFEQTSASCASGANNVTLLHHHLRAKVGGCKKANYEKCMTKGNLVPSEDITKLAVTGKQSSSMFSNKNSILKMYSVVAPFPLNHSSLLFHLRFNPVGSVVNQVFKYDESNFYRQFKLSEQRIFSVDGDVKVHINKYPLLGYFLTNVFNQIVKIWDINHCAYFKTCTQCILYGPSVDCVWSNSICTDVTINHQPKKRTQSTVNACFKIINISPLTFYPSLPTTLTIELDKPLNLAESQETLVIKAGPHNYCTNIKINGSVITCFMELSESGEFSIVLYLVNDNYADAFSIGAESNRTVNISSLDAANTFSIILMLFLGLLLGAFLNLAYAKCNKQQLDRFKAFVGSKKVAVLVESQKSITPVGPKTSVQMNAQSPTNSAKSKELSNKRSKSLNLKQTHPTLSKKPSGKLGVHSGPKYATECVAFQRLAPPLSPQMDTQTQIKQAKSKESIYLGKSSFPLAKSKLNLAPNFKSTKPAKSKESSRKLVKSLNSNTLSRFAQLPNFKSTDQLVKSSNEHRPSSKEDKPLKSRSMDNLEESPKKSKKPKKLKKPRKSPKPPISSKKSKSKKLKKSKKPKKPRKSDSNRLQLTMSKSKTNLHTK